MIVEFVGASGSGKTTVARRILEEVATARPGRRSLARSASFDAAWVSVQPLLGCLSLGAILRQIHQPRSRVKRLWMGIEAWRRRRFLLIVCRYRWQSRHRGVFIHDQGVVQAIGYLTREWPSSETVEDLYMLLGKQSFPDLIVTFNVRPEIAASRTKLSGGLHEDARQVALTQSILDAQTAVVQQRFGVRCVAIDNDRTVAEAVQCVREAIEDHLRTASAPD